MTIHEQPFNPFKSIQIHSNPFARERRFDRKGQSQEVHPVHHPTCWWPQSFPAPVQLTEKENVSFKKIFVAKIRKPDISHVSDARSQSSNDHTNTDLLIIN